MLKIFVSLTLVAFGVLVPVNWTGELLDHTKDIQFSNIDKLSISNIPNESTRFWAHISMSYFFTFWTFYGSWPFFLIFFFIIPITFVQSLANIEGIKRVLPFLKPLIEMKTVKAVVQGFLPGITLKIFLIILPTILMAMSKIEGLGSLSALERRSAAKYHFFTLVNIFLGSIITGTALQQLHSLLNQPLNEKDLILRLRSQGSC